MSRKLLRWQDEAVRDLDKAHGYLFARNPEAARRFAESILDAAERLCEYPELGRVAQDLQPEGRYRSLICGHHRLIYRIDMEVVWLLRVWDTRRNPEDLQV